MFGCHPWAGQASAPWWVELRDAAKHPTVHRTASHKEWYTQNIKRAGMEKSCFSVRCQHHSSQLMESNRLEVQLSDMIIAREAGTQRTQQTHLTSLPSLLCVLFMSPILLSAPGGKPEAGSHWASQKMVEAFPWFSVNNSPKKFFDWPGVGRVLTIEPISDGLSARLGHLTRTWSLMLSSGVVGPFLEKLGLFWAGLPPPLMSFIARTHVNPRRFQQSCGGECHWDIAILLSTLAESHKGRGTWRGHGVCACLQGSWALTFIVRSLDHVGPGTVVRSGFLPPGLWLCKPLRHPGCGSTILDGFRHLSPVQLRRLTSPA